jgi:molecular chaperone HtpG
MYADPLSVVREYVQNSADAIDAGYASGALGNGNSGKIEIFADPNVRELRIIDNGVGLQKSEAESVLVALGDSAKRGTSARGFRGIGRLGGLGFAQQVVFRTRSSANSKITEVAWDCRELRSLLLDSRVRLRVAELLERVVSVSRYSDGEAPPHFFEVCLRGVVRLRNDLLLNETLLRNYLKQVAPLRLDPELKCSADITSFLDAHLRRNVIDLRLNGGAALFRPHRPVLTISATKSDRFTEPEFFQLEGVDGGPAAVGWLLHHGYKGALRGSPEIRGIRARVGDIQIGDESLFASVFPESRFSSWVVGEFHVLDTRIVPNGRRDGFEINAAYSHLLAQLTPLGGRLARLCRTKSIERNRLRTFELCEQEVFQSVKVLRKRRLAPRLARSLLSSAVQAQSRMQGIAEESSLGRVRHDLERRSRNAERLIHRVKDASIDTSDPLLLLPRGKRAAFGEFLAALYACAPSKRVADSLAERLIRRLLVDSKPDSRVRA